VKSISHFDSFHLNLTQYITHNTSIHNFTIENLVSRGSYQIITSRYSAYSNYSSFKYLEVKIRMKFPLNLKYKDKREIWNKTSSLLLSLFHITVFPLSESHGVYNTFIDMHKNPIHSHVNPRKLPQIDICRGIRYSSSFERVWKLKESEWYD